MSAIPKTSSLVDSIHLQALHPYHQHQVSPQGHLLRGRCQQPEAGQGFPAVQGTTGKDYGVQKVGSSLPYSAPK